MRRLSEIAGLKKNEESFRVGDASRFAWLSREKKRVHLFALGDVGSTLLLGLKLLGADCLSAVGIYDVREDMAQRYEFEMNQVLLPGAERSLPPVTVLSEDNLFDCDVFLFCASRRVPPVSEGGDVRMAQFGANAGLVRETAGKAAAASYPGLFGVVSDPVDPLCREAVRAGLAPEQVKGYGLGVMHARGVYYAAGDARFSSYPTEGRAYGPHGEGLILANSLEHYDDALSGELTGLALHANLRMREKGFKPYIAPALSSGAGAVLATVRGEWQYSSTWFGEAFFGAKNRLTRQGIEVENPLLPDPLFDRCQRSYENLKAVP